MIVRTLALFRFGNMVKSEVCFSTMGNKMAGSREKKSETQRQTIRFSESSMSLIESSLAFFEDRGDEVGPTPCATTRPLQLIYGRSHEIQAYNSFLAIRLASKRVRHLCDLALFQNSASVVRLTKHCAAHFLACGSALIAALRLQRERRAGCLVAQ